MVVVYIDSCSCYITIGSLGFDMGSYKNDHWGENMTFTFKVKGQIIIVQTYLNHDISQTVDH